MHRPLDKVRCGTTDPRASLTLSDRKLRACAVKVTFIEAIILSSMLLRSEVESRGELCGQWNSNVDQPMIAARVCFVYDSFGYDANGLTSAITPPCERSWGTYLKVACLSKAVLDRCPGALSDAGTGGYNAGWMVWYMRLESASRFLSRNYIC